MLGGVMKPALTIILVFAVAIAATSQPSAPNYEVGSIVSVKAHSDAQESAGANADSYDVSIKVGDTLYVVLYTPPPGTYGVQQAAGHEMLVSVGPDTLRFNDLLGKPAEVPILRREVLPPENDFDLARAPGRYFNVKYQNLSKMLNLTPNQQAQLKPILQQETGELGAIYANPALSLDARLRRFEKIVSDSDQKLKLFLSGEQWQTLQNMRKEQKEKLRKLVAEKKAR
jgi:hypothetical protein